MIIVIIIMVMMIATHVMMMYATMARMLELFGVDGGQESLQEVARGVVVDVVIELFESVQE